MSPLDDIEIPEMREKTVLSTAVATMPILTFENFSSFTKIKRIMAYMLRFIFNCSNKEKFKGPLTVNELQRTLVRITKFIQQEHFATDIHLLTTKKDDNGKLSQLAPFIDEDGVLRVGGRLKLSDLPY